MSDQTPDPSLQGAETVQDGEILDAFETFGVTAGAFYGRSRLLSAGRLILSLAALPEPPSKSAESGEREIGAETMSDSPPLPP